jgi:hypothetical protein
MSSFDGPWSVRSIGQCPEGLSSIQRLRFVKCIGSYFRKFNSHSGVKVYKKYKIMLRKFIRYSSQEKYRLLFRQFISYQRPRSTEIIR